MPINNRAEARRFSPWMLAGLLPFAVLPGLVAIYETWSRQPSTFSIHLPSARLTPPAPVVEPLRNIAVAPGEARKINAAMPFSTRPNPAAAPFMFRGTDDARERAVDCLAAAEYYEAGDDADGQRAVAQVVLNRLRHPAFPKTVCGVVFQGSERRTGCQFTFSCDGALHRIPSAGAWDRARILARKSLSGQVDRRVGYATHYHTDWVVPYWRDSLEKITEIHTHLFYRWAGWWGTPSAFHRTVSGLEPAVALIARLSPAHAAPGVPALLPETSPMMQAASLAEIPAAMIGTDAIGSHFGPARLLSADSVTSSFIVALDRVMPPETYPSLATIFCAGRQRCRILAWPDDATTPRTFPVAPEQLASMRFSYFHDVAKGVQRPLWNCALFPRADADQCMIRPGTPAATPPRPTALSQSSATDAATTKRADPTISAAPPPPAKAQ